MKIKLLLVLLLVSFITFSQNTDVTLNIVLKPIQTITIDPTQKVVNLTYDTKDKYADGVSRTYADHIEVFSTGGFIINVKGSGNLTNSKISTQSIPLSDVSITASNGSNTTGNFTYPIVRLSTTNNKTLISSNSGGRNLKYNVTYDNSLATGDRYINKYFNSESNESVYTTTLTYTISPS